MSCNIDLEKIFNDEQRIKQLILIIMNNALKYTFKGYIKLSIEDYKGSEDEIY